MSQPLRMAEVTPQKSAVEVAWSDAHRSRYLHQWLRENCTCDDCGTSLSGQRGLRLRDFDDAISARSVRQDESSHLQVVWSDGHQSRFEPDWLRAHCNCDSCRASRAPALEPWDACLDPDELVVRYEEVMADDVALFDLIATLVRLGVARVKGVPADQTRDLGGRLGYLHDTNYGLVMDIRAEAGSWFRALSAEAIPPHTDNVYRYDPTGICLFHCVEQVPGGGGASCYVDGLSLAARVRETDPDAFECLCTVPLTYYRHIPANADMNVEAAYFKTRSTVFRTDYDGQVIGFRYHPRNIAPMSMDEETTTRMYRARRCLEEMTEDPRLRIQFVAEPGECTIFDNHRVLHARTGFQQATGVRHFRQCHVDREELHSRYRLLGERLDRPVPEEQLTRGLV